MNKDTFKALLNAQNDAQELHDVVEGLKAVSPTIRLQVAKLRDAMTAAVGMAHRDVIINALADSGVTDLTHTQLAELDIIELQQLLQEALAQVGTIHITVDDVIDLEGFLQSLEAQVNEEELNTAVTYVEVEDFLDEVGTESIEAFERSMAAHPSTGYTPDAEEAEVVALSAVEEEVHPEALAEEEAEDAALVDAGAPVEGESHPEAQEEDVNLVLAENTVERGEVDADGAPYVADEL